MFSKDFNVFMAELPQAAEAMVAGLLKNESLSDINTTFRTNPEKGLGLLFRNLYNPLCSYASVLLHSDQLAEEVVSEVFFQFYRTKAYKTVQSNYVSYLLKLVVNECFTHAYDPERKLERLPAPGEIFADSQKITENYYSNFLLKIASVVSQLSAQSQQIFLLSWSQNYSYFEIGQKLKISPKTVEIQLLNVIRKLADRPFEKQKAGNILHFNNQILVADRPVSVDTSFRTRIVNVRKTKFAKIFTIDENIELPLAKQLVICILKALYEKTIQDGDRIPSVTRASSFLCVSPEKVQKAYHDLKKIGIIAAIHGNGYFIMKHPYWREKEMLGNFQTLTNSSYDSGIRFIENQINNFSASEVMKNENRFYSPM